MEQAALDDERAPWEREWWWSEQQLEVFTWFGSGDGNLVVRARAGTGKTTTIVEGVRRAPEERILLAAFNRTIAEELQKRVSARNVEAKTLHGLGMSYLRQHTHAKLDAPERGRRLVAEVEPGAPRPMARIIKELHTRIRDVDPFVAVHGSPADVVAYAAAFDLLPDEEWLAKGWSVERVCEAAFKAILLAREPTEIIDFADMIFLPLVHQWVGPRYDMVVVDEAQDMTGAQLTMAVHAGRGRVCVVGDDRQAIYKFRGADSEALDRLKGALHAAELGLTVTRRCPKLVVAFAAKIVPDFEAADDAPDGVIDMMPGSKLLGSVAVGDFVLSRKNAPLVRVVMELLKRGVRARIRGNDIGAGIVALVERLAALDVDDLRAKARAWADKECARARKNLADDAADERCAFVRDQEAIVLAVVEECEVLAQIDERIARLFSDDSSPAVMCSSIHRAKGLEADTVYVLADTLRADSLEERNLVYVAVTRTKRRLVLVEGAI